MSEKKEIVLVLDFGSQYNQLICRRVREAGVYSEMVPFDISWDEIQTKKPQALILSGGPSSVYETGAFKCAPRIFNSSIPVLGICYGMQLMALELGGEVSGGEKREYGRTEIEIISSEKETELFQEIPNHFIAWMSHGDKVNKLPQDFINLATSETTPFAAMAGKINSSRFNKFGVQFHPEVIHTNYSQKIITNFLYNIAHCKGNWTMSNFIDDQVSKIQEIVGKNQVLCGISGGVDSAVTAMLIYKAIGDHLTCIFVDNGLLRKGEAEQVQNTFHKFMGLNFHFVDRSDLFLPKLSGISDPEEKRKIIGHTFINIFEKEARELGHFKFLGQGTLYPDVIESSSAISKAADRIKTHHNVGGLPKKFDFELIEPLKLLFKDECRLVGKELGLPDEITQRHPFPGPGLAVRVLGNITPNKLKIAQEADAILIEELKKSNWYEKVWQALAVLTPLKSVGVMGDFRTYENLLALRIVNSQDGMTADWSKLPYELLEKISNRIINEVKGINRVVYDITTKPPATIEWE